MPEFIHQNHQHRCLQDLSTSMGWLTAEKSNIATPILASVTAHHAACRIEMVLEAEIEICCANLKNGLIKHTTYLKTPRAEVPHISYREIGREMGFLESKIHQSRSWYRRTRKWKWNLKYSFDIWTYDIAIVSEHKYKWMALRNRNSVVPLLIVT